MKRYIVRFENDEETIFSVEFEFIGKGDPPTEQQFKDEVFAAVRSLAEKQDMKQLSSIKRALWFYSARWSYTEMFDTLKREAGLNIGKPMSPVARYIIDNPSADISAGLLWVALKNLDKDRWREYDKRNDVTIVLMDGRMRDGDITELICLGDGEEKK